MILPSVFLTGAAVLIIEIAAIRVLSPYYGNTLYTTSAVLGVVLAALSAGYYLGGKLADKYPLQLVFYSIIFAGGLLVVAAQWLANTILPSLGPLLPITTGPLVASVFLFMVPCFALGMLSPYAIALRNRESPHIGQRSGEVFFWSTLGSITGSLAAGFLLIPTFGVSAIISGTGLGLCVLGSLGCLLTKRPAWHTHAMFLLLGAATVSLFFSLPPTQPALYEKDGVYERIKIADGIWEGRPTRFLFQDKSYSAAMRLDSDELAYEYTKYYALYRLFNPSPKSAFIIGGGAYSIPKALLKDEPNISIDVTEIEPELYPLAKQYFNLPEDPRLRNHTQDGRYFLSRSDATYDIILSDVYYSFFSIPVQFTTKEFFELSKNHLAENGVFIGNFVGDLHPEAPSFILSEIKTFRQVFPNSYFFAVQDPASARGQNIIFLGVNGTKAIDFATQPTLAQKHIDVDRISLQGHAELTDDFAPVEYYVSKSLSRYYQ